MSIFYENIPGAENYFHAFIGIYTEAAERVKKLITSLFTDMNN
jgi:hypothetical protein